jgi:hypothetical protein
VAVQARFGNNNANLMVHFNSVGALCECPGRSSKP